MSAYSKTTVAAGETITAVWGNHIQEQYDDAMAELHRAATVVVAASNANARSKAAADYVCDGVDDDVTLETAFAALPSTGGRIILTEGTFTISSNIGMTSKNTILEGQGMRASIIKVKNALAADIAMLSMGTGAYGALKNLTLDGNSPNQSGAYTWTGFSIDQMPFFDIEGVDFKNMYGSGYAIFGYGLDASQVLRIAGCHFDNNSNIDVYTYNVLSLIMESNMHVLPGSNCIDLSNQSGGFVVVKNNILYGPGLVGITCPVPYAQIMGNEVTLASTGILVSGNESMVKDNRVETSSVDGIVVNLANNCNVEGNTCIGNTGSNIKVTGSSGDTATYNFIHGNICRKGGGCTYGIRVDNSYAQYTLITGNDCYDGGSTAGISNAGTSTSFGAGNRNKDGTFSTTPN